MVLGYQIIASLQRRRKHRPVLVVNEEATIGDRLKGVLGPIVKVKLGEPEVHLMSVSTLKNATASINYQ